MLNASTQDEQRFSSRDSPTGGRAAVPMANLVNHWKVGVAAGTNDLYLANGAATPPIIQKSIKNA
jgi:hypothetical protein